MTSRPPRRQSRRRRDTPPPRTGSNERDVLVGFLDYLRVSAAAKVKGVPEREVRTPGVESGTNLLGLIRHLTHVERYIFLGEDVADWPATFHAASDETVESILTGYREAIDAANQHIAGCADLNDPVEERTVGAVGTGSHDRGDRPPPRRHPARAHRRRDRPVTDGPFAAESGASPHPCPTEPQQQLRDELDLPVGGHGDEVEHPARRAPDSATFSGRWRRVIRSTSDGSCIAVGA